MKKILPLGRGLRGEIQIPGYKSIDGFTGGYNLQAAFAMGIAAAEHAARRNNPFIV